MLQDHVVFPLFDQTQNRCRNEAAQKTGVPHCHGKYFLIVSVAQNHCGQINKSLLSLGWRTALKESHYIFFNP